MNVIVPYWLQVTGAALRTGQLDRLSPLALNPETHEENWRSESGSDEEFVFLRVIAHS